MLTDVPQSMGSKSREGRDIYKWGVPSQQGRGSLNSRRVARLLNQTSREDDRFGVVDKVLAYGTEGTQIEPFPPSYV
ncbi:hypothetical protein TNCV_4537361 [Trichonephila clavipes]|nr:hypothetical protein TNCV_4537361 [Trichonephila clavipes]